MLGTTYEFGFIALHCNLKDVKSKIPLKFQLVLYQMLQGATEYLPISELLNFNNQWFDKQSDKNLQCHTP